MNYPRYPGYDGDTLSDAKGWLRHNLDVGAPCPCCGQLARQYRRKLSSGMAAALVRMYAAHGTKWQDKTETLRGFGSAARDESLLRFWGLLAEADLSRQDGGRAGWWRVTGRGETFVKGRTRFQSHAVIYDGKLRGFEGELVSITDCLGSRFDLAELLAA